MRGLSQASGIALTCFAAILICSKIGYFKGDLAHRAAIWRHLASIRFAMAFTLASSAAQKARLTAAVRFFGGTRLAILRGAFASTGGSKTKGTEAASASGEPTEAK